MTTGLNHKTMQHKPIQSVQLDIHKMDINNDGVKDFFWPVSHKECASFGNDIVKACSSLIRNADDGDALIPYKLIAKYFTAEAVGIFQGDLLRERFKESGKEVSVPSSWRLWPPLLKKESPSEIPFLDNLRQGPAKPNYTKKILNLSRLKKLSRLFHFKKNGLTIDGLKIKAVTAKHLSDTIIATQRTETICLHAQEEQKDVIFCRSHKWFKKIEDDELQASLSQNNEKLEKSILDAVSDLYEQNNIKLEPHAYRYLKRVLTEGAALLRIHYARLVNKPDKLPKHIWTGSGGNIWDMTLRLAVMAQNGTAEGHDHAMGQGVYALALTPFIEFWGADRFITFNQSQSDGLLANPANTWAIMDRTMADIANLEKRRNNDSIKTYPKFNLANPDIKTIALMTTIYDRDRGRLTPVPADIVAVDWQARLISHLKSWGYNVILKRHPESPILPPPSFEAKLGAKIVAGKFEDMLDTVDMILFDYIYTTTFRTVLETNIPVAIADYYDILWSPHVKELIEKRCAIVNGCYDKFNRAQIDWNALKSGIKEAPSKANNHDFACVYLP